MYSGLTFTKKSGRLVGTHQKIDRVSRSHLKGFLLANDVKFPKTKQILNFEGLNGPDGIKRKSPAKNEPWHYIDPFDESDTNILDIISTHYANLVKSLKAEDIIKSSFEAAWLAHAVVDGLTPAHHYPYEEKLKQLRGGEGIETRTTIKKKIILPGDTKREQLKNNWKMWGPGGLFTAHYLFEWGVASLIAPMRCANAKPSQHDTELLNKLGYIDWYMRQVRDVGALRIYDRFLKFGWTAPLAKTVRKHLIPVLVMSVTQCWYAAAQEAGLIKQAK